MRFISLLLSLSIGVFFLPACSSTPIDASNPDALYKDAEEDIQSKRYLVASEKLRGVKNKFPYSNVATQAQLRLADVYFYQESFSEAAAAYESFKDLHPKHPRIDYVLYQISESYWNQLPGGPDRDATAALKALDSLKEIITLYPKSEYYDNALQKRSEIIELLAKKEMYIGDYYFKRKMFDSAATRYEKITNLYESASSAEDAYWFLHLSLLKQEKLSEAKHALTVYLSRFPNGKHAQRSKEWLKENEHD